MQGTQPPSSKEAETSSVPVDVTLEEEIDLEDLDEILEELIVDIVPEKSGWAGTPEPIMNYKEESASKSKSIDTGWRKT